MQLVLQQRFAQRLLHFPLAGDSLLPAWESHNAYKAVDLIERLFKSRAFVVPRQYSITWGQIELLAIGLHQSNPLVQLPGISRIEAGEE